MIAWLDTETTGLDPSVDFLLEVGIILTDDELHILAQFETAVSYIPMLDTAINQQLDADDGFTRKMHTTNGLIADMAWAPRVHLAEDMAVSFVRAHCIGGKPVMGGNSITHDRIFLRKFMPTLLEEFHYRSIDVSGIREAASRWSPGLEFPVRPKNSAHRVIDDLHDSIDLARFERENIFNPTTTKENTAS